MSNLIYYEIGILVIALILFILYRMFRRPKNYPYFKNPYFISMAERKLFFLLQNIVGEKYYIFPQVSIGSLLHVEDNISEKEYWTYLNKINRKSVDFVLAEKGSFKQILAIELNDRSHNRPDRIKRDEFVRDAFKAAGMMFLPLENKSYSTTELAEILTPLLI